MGLAAFNRKRRELAGDVVDQTTESKPKRGKKTDKSE